VSDYPFPFHPLELGEAALREFFGYRLEGIVDPGPIEPETRATGHLPAPAVRLLTPASAASSNISMTDIGDPAVLISTISDQFASDRH
jgi:hypothetical protein